MGSREIRPQLRVHHIVLVEPESSPCGGGADAELVADRAEAEPVAVVQGVDLYALADLDHDGKPGTK
ncbi:MAG: hypothetical protein ACRDTH_21235 [Pseudonocardiaceae bacterium]